MELSQQIVKDDRTTILIIYDVDDENVHLYSPSILLDHRRRGLSLIAWHFKSVEEKRWEYLIDPGVHNDHDSIDEKIWLTECQYWCYPGSRCTSVSGAKVLRSHENPRRKYRTHGAMSFHIHIYRTSNLVYFQLKLVIAFGYFTVFCAFNLCSKSLSLRLKSSQRCECTVGVAGVPDNSQSSVKFPPIFFDQPQFFLTAIVISLTATNLRCNCDEILLLVEAFYRCLGLIDWRWRCIYDAKTIYSLSGRFQRNAFDSSRSPCCCVFIFVTFGFSFWCVRAESMKYFCFLWMWEFLPFCLICCGEHLLR